MRSTLSLISFPNVIAFETVPDALSSLVTSSFLILEGVLVLPLHHCKFPKQWCDLSYTRFLAFPSTSPSLAVSITTNVLETCSQHEKKKKRMAASSPVSQLHHS